MGISNFLGIGKEIEFTTIRIEDGKEVEIKEKFLIKPADSVHFVKYMNLIGRIGKISSETDAELKKAKMMELLEDETVATKISEIIDSMLIKSFPTLTQDERNSLKMANSMTLFGALFDVHSSGLSSKDLKDFEKIKALRDALPNTTDKK